MNNSGRIVNLVNPGSAQDAATRSYVDSAVATATAAGVSNPAFQQGSATSSAQYLYPATNNPAAIFTNGTYRVYVAPSGNVGIGPGHTSPSVTLDVAGAAKISGVLNMSSNKITNLTTPDVGADAANKYYVDTSIPIGGIIMWSGAFALPSNWKLCDGANGTPDLRGRFVLSSGSGSGLTGRSVGQAGGVETVALSEGQMPSHSHGVTARTGDSSGVATDGGHTHTIKDDGHSHTTSSVSTTVTAYGPLGVARGDYVNVPVAPYNSSGTWNPFSASTSVTVDSKKTGISINTTDSAHNHTITVSETAKGSGNAHENMPPFYVLAFIMRVS